MSRVKAKVMSWNPGGAETTEYAVYAGKANLGSAWLAAVDAGTIAPMDTVPATAAPSYTLVPNMFTEDTWQLAVCGKDAAGNFSDPLQGPAWQSVPLDLTPPAPPTGALIN